MKSLVVVLLCCAVSLGQAISGVTVVQNQTASHPVTKPSPKPVHTVQPKQIQSQHQQQQQGQSQAQQAQANNNQAFSSNYHEIRQTPFAFAPEAMSTAPCRVAGSAGVSSPFAAVAIGGSKQDKECDKRLAAQAFALIGQYQAALQILCSTDAAKVVKDCANLAPPILVAEEEPVTEVDEVPTAPQIVFTQSLILEAPPVVMPRLQHRRHVVKHKAVCPK